MPEVVVLQRALPHYRIPFFRRLQERLGEKGVALKLVYGRERPGTVPRTVMVDFPWARRIENRYLSLLGKELVWQPAMEEVWNADLVVVEQAGRLLLNYLLIARRRWGGPLIAYWGHGTNLQAPGRRPPGGFLQKRLMKQVDAWFAYTNLSAEIVRGYAYPEDRLFVVQNAIDNEEFRRSLSDLSEEEVKEKKRDLRILGDKVGLYCGGMVPDKRLDFLLDACREIKRKIPDFEMVFLGDGPERIKVERSAARCSWIHDVGPRFGPDRAPYFAMSRVLLMPGLVGLVIVDAFIANTPLFTTDIPIHSPEIAYLVNGVNGVMTPPSLETYVEAVVGFFHDPGLRETLAAGCRDSARRYTLENMVDNFAHGVEACLHLGRLKS